MNWIPMWEMWGTWLRAPEGTPGQLRQRWSAAVAVLCLLWSAAPAAAGGAPHEDEIVAGFVFNFCKVVTWPDRTRDELVLAVVGTDGPSLALLKIDGRQVGERTLRVLRQDPLQPLAACDLVYISPTSPTNLDSLVQVVGSAPVLTISTAEDFCRRGGIVQLDKERGKIRLRINNKKARAADLILSSQLLKIATVTDD